MVISVEKKIDMAMSGFVFKALDFFPRVSNCQKDKLLLAGKVSDQCNSR